MKMYSAEGLYLISDYLYDFSITGEEISLVDIENDWTEYPPEQSLPAEWLNETAVIELSSGGHVVQTGIFAEV